MKDYQALLYTTHIYYECDQRLAEYDKPISSLLETDAYQALRHKYLKRRIPSEFRCTAYELLV
jgi:hypothetical protein